MYGEEYEIEIRTGQFAVKLSIAAQMMFDLYVEPTEDEPEEEDRLYIWSYDDVEVQIAFIKDKIDALRLDVAGCIALESLGATFKEASDIFIRRNGHQAKVDFESDHMYAADEDLMFLYYWLGCLHSFIFDAEMFLDQLKEDA